MKKLFSFILAIVFVIASTGLSFPAHAIIPGEDVAPNNASITYGQIQDLIEEYFDVQQMDLSFGTEHFYQYAFNQVHEDTDQALVNHPAYEQILSYLTRYMLMYQDYLMVSHVMEQNAASDAMMLATSFTDNPCLIYDNITNEFNFVLTDEFLAQTLAEHKAENDAKLAEVAAWVLSQRSTTYSVPSYSPTNAINYAYSYVHSDGTMLFSPIYPSYSSNCTNYVSQCIHAGGLAMNGSNSSAGIHSSTTAWYCRPLTSTYSLSTSWVRATDFYSYMYKNANSTRMYYTVEELYENCRPGDVVQLVRKSNSEVYHSVIITQKDFETARYCAHSTGRRNADISEQFNDETMKYILHTFLPSTPVPGTPLTDCGICGAVPSNVRHQSSISYDSVVACPLHNELHDAYEVYTTYDTFCNAHGVILGSGTEMSGYECIN